MSVLTIGGRRFAAGLYWLERGGAASVARNARAFRRPWYVHRGGQTGYAADEGNPGGCPSLAAALQAHIAEPSWMALVEADDGRLALVKARDGAMLADGDEVFGERAPALEAFARARDAGWALHATPGLVGEGAGALDPSALADDPAMLLAAAPLSGAGLPRVGRFLALAALMAAGAVLSWTQRDALWRLVSGPEQAAEVEEAPVDPPVAAALDAAALIAGCRAALLAHPPWLPAWRTERVSCEGRFSDPSLTAVRPELEGRAVLVARWRLDAGRPEPLHRRIAESRLSGWYAAQVGGASAWAAVPLEPVLRLSDAAPPPLVKFRAAVDRSFGARAARIDYAAQGADGIEVAIAARRPPALLADAVARVPGLELVRLARDAAGEWRLEGRRVSPVSMPQSRFEELANPLARPASQPASRAPAAAGPASHPCRRSYRFGRKHPCGWKHPHGWRCPAGSRELAEGTTTGRPDHG